MNPLIRWNPFNELTTMQRQMETLVNGASHPDTAAMPSPEAWTPVVDVFEDEKNYLFKAELPEVKKEDVTVQFENGVLTLAGERRVEKDLRIRRVHRIERTHGAFFRSFELPDDVDPENIAANFKDGVLTIAVAKVEAAQPRKIEMRVA